MRQGCFGSLGPAGFVAGGILAGVVSDYTGGRATTCTVMLLLAAPLV